MKATARTHAHCAPNGAIHFGTYTPGQHIPLAVGEDALVRRRITATARRSPQGQLFVPGVAEAFANGHTRERYSAIARYIVELDQFSGPGFMAVGA
ncbi:hypothetical protein [Marinimicrobium sp. ARAG 43.8]|uniref:hypothetical protein n=1 Tax=Marinimicrobium sp. ARAG 43.8 TaxID=3418719 RepID=UPI003CEFA74F